MILFCHVLATSCFGTYRPYHRISKLFIITGMRLLTSVVCTVRILRILKYKYNTVRDIYFNIPLVSRSSFMRFCIIRPYFVPLFHRKVANAWKINKKSIMSAGNNHKAR